ncbi:MAG: hypothetical protein AB7S48_17075 [Bacteroidales bacterium]
MNVVSNQCKENFTEEELLSLIRSVVGRYIQRRAIPSREQEDVVMDVMEKFLKQKEKIFGSFEGKSKFTTYCIAVANRMCCEVIRRDCKQWYLVTEKENSNLPNETALNHHEAEKKFLFKQEVKRLETILFFFNNDYAKLILFLKVYYSMPISNNDIKNYADLLSEKVRSIITEEKSTTKGDVFIRLAEVVNLVEQKDIRGDAVRIWFTNQINTIIRRLNGNGIANHDKESLSILLEMLFNDNLKSLN